MKTEYMKYQNGCGGLSLRPGQGQIKKTRKIYSKHGNKMLSAQVNPPPPPPTPRVWQRTVRVTGRLRVWQGPCGEGLFFIKQKQKDETVKEQKKKNKRRNAERLKKRMFPPPLPPAPSWYPGHMSRFARLLPAFLSRTDIVIELRDARLPLTSINPAFESE